MGAEKILLQMVCNSFERVGSDFLTQADISFVSKVGRVRDEELRLTAPPGEPITSEVQPIPLPGPNSWQFVSRNLMSSPIPIGNTAL